MIYVVLFGSSIVFVELFLILDLAADGRTLVRGARESLQTLGRDDMSDEAKEAFARSASLSILRRTAMFALKLLVIAAVLYALYSAAVFALPALEPGLTRSLVSPAAMAALTLAAACYVLLRHAVIKHL